MNKSKKYVNGSRFWIYGKLVDKFGQWRDKGWTLAGPVGLESEYIAFLGYLAEQLSKTHGVKFTASGIALQVKMAISQQTQWKCKRSADSLSSQVFVNKAAAYEAGFIRLRDMPVEMIFFYGKNAA